MSERELRHLATQWAIGIRSAAEKTDRVEPAPLPSSSASPKRSLRVMNNVPANIDDDLADVARPKTRADCLNMERPCPFVSCKHHLYLDVSKEGLVSIAVPDLELWEMIETCSLDVAEEGCFSGMGAGDGATLETIALIYNLSRERVRQIETVALRKLQRKLQLTVPEYTEEYGKIRTRRVVEREEGEEDEEDCDS